MHSAVEHLISCCSFLNGIVIIVDTWSPREDTQKQLDSYYGLVKRQILRYQSPTTGLFPVLSTEK
jgi:hypothetical protein